MQGALLESIDLSDEFTTRVPGDEEDLVPRTYNLPNGNKRNLSSPPSEQDCPTEYHMGFWGRWKQWNMSWKSGLYIGLYTSLIVLVSNITLLLVGCFSQGGIVSGIGTIAQGRPENIQRMSTAYHVLINMLSTVLLISSNYAMQILCAPTRAELNKAHDQGMWLDIGIVSLHNLRFIEKRRVVLFWILACSSVPLHLFYNSAIFQVTAGQDYQVEMMYPDSPFPKDWQRLENSQWIKLYSSPFVPGYGNLRLVMTEVAFSLVLNSNLTMSFQSLDYQNSSAEVNCNWTPRLLNNNRTELSFVVDVSSNSFESILKQDYRTITTVSDLRNFSLTPYDLPAPNIVSINGTSSITDTTKLCSDLDCDDPACPKSDWLATHPLRVGYAIAEPVEHSSKIQISIHFMLIVIVANLAKLGALYLTLRYCLEGHLITLGDAIASYLEDPEQEFAGKCTLGRSELLQKRNLQKVRPWRYKPTHTIRLLGRSRLWSSLLLPCIAFTNISFLTAAYHNVSPQEAKEKYVSWGTASKLLLPFTRSSFDAKGVVVNAWLANTPQVLLSVSYFSINRICTSICSAIEWNNFGQRKKGLRVTSPSFEQRSTHFLQIPYRWAIPLASTSGLLHWLLSQTLFLVRYEKRTIEGTLYPDSTCACGYSPLSLLVFTLCFLTLLMVILWLVIKPVTAYIPAAGHCSIVISAACHPPAKDMYAHLGKVQWGALPKGNSEEVGHCTFTSGPVMTLTEGELYA